jgi:hypothetical protein
MAAGNPNMMRGMAAGAKEAAKLEGAPLLQVVRMSVKGVGGTAEAGSESRRSCRAAPGCRSQPQEEAPSIGSVLGGRLGRLGGFGRRKKQQKSSNNQRSSRPSATATGTRGRGAGRADGNHIEMSGFSTAGVDGRNSKSPQASSR